MRDRTLQDCGAPRPGPPCCLLHPGEQGWTGEMTSDSGQGTSSQVANGASRLDTSHAGRSLEDGETDEAGDASVFDYSSVTSCSPDGTLRSGAEGSNSGEEEVTKKRTRRAVKFQRAITGASLQEIMAKRNQKPEVRKAQREQAIR